MISGLVSDISQHLAPTPPGGPRPDFAITTPCFSDGEATLLMQELTELLAKKGAKRFRSEYDATIHSITITGWVR